MKIQKPFRIILILYAQFLTKNVLIHQNVLIPPNCILMWKWQSLKFKIQKLFENNSYKRNKKIVMIKGNSL